MTKYSGLHLPSTVQRLENYQFVKKKYEYRHSVQDYNNIAPSHKTHGTTQITRT